jgi:hypothetical protein
MAIFQLFKKAAIGGHSILTFPFDAGFHFQKVGAIIPFLRWNGGDRGNIYQNHLVQWITHGG